MIKSKELNQYVEDVLLIVRNLEDAIPPELHYLVETCIAQIEERKPATTYHKWGGGYNKKIAECPVCGLSRIVKTQIGWNFCPCCGAEFGGIN